MLTTRAAHALLTDAHAADGCVALARALGFGGVPHRLAAKPLRALGLADIEHSRALRLVRDHSAAILIVEQIAADGWRATLQRLATQLDNLADPRRWMILLQCRAQGPLVLACWLSSSRGPRLAVLATSPARVLDSDAQTVAALAAAWQPDPTQTCLRWHDLLGRQAIGRRFFRTLDAQVRDIADAWPARVATDERRTLALIHVARLLFLKFLEAKGWLDDDRNFLARHTEQVLATGGDLSRRLIAPLTFGTLNTPYRQRAAAARAFGAIPFLNGGLFACTPLEKRTRQPAISDTELAALLLDTLARYRFTAREDAQSWSEAAIDPDLLGRTFEALMDTGERRGSGTFYTPGALVASLVDDALEHAVAAPRHLVRAALNAESVGSSDVTRLLSAIDRMRVIDPACGSGSMLVATLERLAGLRQQLGDPRPIAAIRRQTLTDSIFGVDLAPMAVWLCELRLWLSVVIDDETTRIHDVSPLPNLDHHIRIGDALGNDAFEGSAVLRTTRSSALRERYARSSGARKRAWALRIEQLEREHATRLENATLSSLQHERRDLLQLARQHTLFGGRQGLTATQRKRLAVLRTQLAQHRRAVRRLQDGGAVDFDFRSHFSDAAAQGGFDLVIGNPPWVRSEHLDSATRARLRARFAAVTRHSVAGTAFGVQGDIAIPFTHRGLELTRPGGVLAFLLPNKLWRSVAAGALRDHLLRTATPLHLRDHAADAGGFAAAVYPSAIVLRRAAPPLAGDSPRMHSEQVDCHTTDAAGTQRHFSIAAAALPATAQPGAPWRLIPDAVRAAADALSHAGVHWSDTILPPPSLGVKTGCNDAFLLPESELPDALRPWARPVLRGDGVRPWVTTAGSTVIIAPTDESGRALPKLSAPLARHFAAHRRALSERTDLRPREAWWSLFRTELLSSNGWRVVWADIGKTLRATLLQPHAPLVPLNSCYGVRLHDPVDAHALTALLNAPLTTAWLSLVAEPARGGYHRFLGWTVLALPMPRWDRARELLAPLAARARRGELVSVETLHSATLAAYDIRHAAIAPLLEWTSADLRTQRLQALAAS
jgi:N-6 DNA Methylase